MLNGESKNKPLLLDCEEHIFLCSIVLFLDYCLAFSLSIIVDDYCQGLLLEMFGGSPELALIIVWSKTLTQGSFGVVWLRRSWVFERRSAKATNLQKQWWPF